MTPVWGTFSAGTARGFGRALGLSMLNTPLNLSSSLPTNGQIALIWTNGDNSAQTEIYRNGTLITTVGVGVSSFTNTGLTDSTTYSYYVRHIRDNRVSVNSNTISPRTRPAIPLNLSYFANSTTQLTLSWTNGNSGLLTRIFLSGVGVIDSVAAGVTSYTVSGLSANSNNTYFVYHEENGVNSAFSNSITAYTTPNGPFNLSATAASATQINLTWINSHSLPTQIYRSTGAFVAEVSAGVTTYAVTGLTASTTYTYIILHINNTSGLSSALSVGAQATTQQAQVVSPNSSTLRETYSSPGTYSFSIPTGYNGIFVEAAGGGGGGGAAVQSNRAGSGGGGGGYVTKTLITAAAGQVVTITVGAGGTGGSLQGGSGGNGGNTTITTVTGVSITANGGTGGGVSPGTGGSFSGGAGGFTGGNGGQGQSPSSLPGDSSNGVPGGLGASGQGVWGGGGGGACGMGGAGGNGGTPIEAGYQPAEDGFAPGGGGGGGGGCNAAFCTNPGKLGAAGAVKIYY